MLTQLTNKALKQDLSPLGERGRRGKKLPRGFQTVDRVEREASDTGAKPPQTPEQVTFDNF
jgi:hypothetical protein